MLAYHSLKESEIERVNQLNNVGVGTWKNEFFSPEKPHSFVIICTDKGKDEFIGCEGYVDYKLAYNKEVVQTHRSERTIINPNYRGKGIFNALVGGCDELAKQGNSHMSWGATGALKAFGRVGFDQFSGFRNYIFYPVRYNLAQKIGHIFSNLRLLNPIKAYKNKKSGNLSELRKLLSFLSMLKGAKRHNSSTKNVALKSLNYDEIKELILAGSTDQYCIIPNESLFNWLGSKKKSYHKYGLYINDKLAGYCIYKKNQDTKFIHVVDIYCAEPNNFNLLLEKISDIERKNKTHCIFVPLNAKNKTHELFINEVQKAGVINIQKAGSFVIKTLHGGDSIKIDNLLLTDLWLEL